MRKYWYVFVIVVCFLIPIIGMIVESHSHSERAIARITVSSTEVQEYEIIVFNASDSNISDGQIISYEWEFGDGTTASSIMVEHTYDVAGQYYPQLTVTDDEGKYDQEEIKIIVKPLKTRYDLGEAIDKKIIHARITGDGIAGATVEVSLRLTKPRPYDLEIVIAKGMVLQATSNVQNMVVKELLGIPTRDRRPWRLEYIPEYIEEKAYEPVSSIMLEKVHACESKDYLLEAYSLEFHADAPHNTEFAVAGVADASILNIFEASESLSITDVLNIQIAIWVVTDDVSRKELENRFTDMILLPGNAKKILEAAGIEVMQKELFIK